MPSMKISTYCVPPRMTDDDECGAVSGIRIDMENRGTRRKPAPVPFSTTNPS
jgi:hypothetical protein